MSARVLDVLRALCAQHGATALIVSHHPVAEAQADRVLRRTDGTVAVVPAA